MIGKVNPNPDHADKVGVYTYYYPTLFACIITRSSIPCDVAFTVSRPNAHNFVEKQTDGNMALLRTKRYLVSTGYYPPSKKARYQSRPAMRIPRSLLPEMKQYTKSFLTQGTATTAQSYIPQDMAQGDGSNEFVGHKFRVMRLRVHYDFSDAVVTTGGIRIVVYIPKNPSELTFPIGNNVSPIDTTRYTVLKDLQLPGDPSRLAGWFDVKGPINVELDLTGSVLRKNALGINVVSRDNQSSATYLNNRTTYSLWYTDN